MKNHAAQESGTALIVAMLLMLVLTIMLIGFYFVTNGEQKVSASNRDNEVTYYAAVAGLEQMSNLMANYFAHTASPTPAEITAWTTTASNFQSLNYTTPTGITYKFTTTPTLYCTAPCNPAPCTPPMVLCSSVGNVLGSSNGAIGGNGPLAGLEGVITPFQLTVIADGPNNTEVKLTRTVQEVAVPIFEFGIFSDSDLSFHAGSNFSFGGRVHTNGNLFLGEDGGNTLLLDDHVTAAKGIIRAQLSNGYVIQTGGSYSYTVDVLTAAGGCPGPPPVPAADPCRALGLTEGSVTGGPGSAVNPNWLALSKTTYNSFIQDGKTGAKVLNLAIALPGINSQPIAMIQRPPTTPPAAYESPTSALGMARFYNQASLRILLSDTAADINNLPGIDTTVQPYPLAELNSSGMANTIQRTNSAGAYYLPPTDACHPPLAESSASTSDSMLAAGTTVLGGYIKIEMQLGPQAPGYSPGKWQDVTEEILAQGISRDEASGAADQMPAPGLSDSGTNGSLSNSKTYYYVVTALGAWSETAGTEANHKTGSSTTSVQLTWTAVTGASGYNVYRGTSAGKETGYIYVSGGTTTSYTDTGAALTAQTPPTPCTNTSIVHLEEAVPAAATSPTSGVTLCPAPVTGQTPPTCSWSASGLATVSNAQNFVPINMYDAREGEVRDSSTATAPSLNGIMNLVEIDVGNLQQWFAGNIATSGKYALNGPDALNNSGYLVYTSDRRMNCDNNGTSGQYDLEGDASCAETGEFGNEDIINPSVTNGAPNNTLDAPEDVDGDTVFRTYGAYAHPITTPASVSPTGVTVGGAAATGKWPAIISSVANSATENPAEVRMMANQAQINSVVIFRRALRLVNGTAGNLPPLANAKAAVCSGGLNGGFTVTSENPIYVQGDYNASVANGFTDVSGKCHVPASVMGDAVTLLSKAWQPGAQSGFTSGDADSFANPTNTGNRVASTTYYRVAVMAGKTIPFPQPSWGAKDTGTDGGTHNFLRYDENWGGQTLNYLGSLASFYFSRQGTGIYKYNFNNVVYNPPTRNYTFDTDFQNINKLPPGTPRFTDVNALSYYQSILPSQ